MPPATFPLYELHGLLLKCRLSILAELVQLFIITSPPEILPAMPPTCTEQPFVLALFSLTETLDEFEQSDIEVPFVAPPIMPPTPEIVCFNVSMAIVPSDFIPEKFIDAPYAQPQIPPKNDSAAMLSPAVAFTT